MEQAQPDHRLEVGLNIWRQYLETDDRAFLEHNYPLLADAARFLLAYAVEGADGKLHTSPSNAHETQWDVSDPITDTPGDADAVPDRDRGRDAARPGRRARHPAAGRAPEAPRLPARDAQRPDRVRLLGDPLAQLRNIENLDLEPIFP